LWNYEKVTKTDGTESYTDPHIIGVYGDTGSPGSPGSTGVGISSITEYYLATSASSGVTRSTSGWTTTVQSTTSTNKYLWNYEKIVYTNNTTAYTDPRIIGTYGDTGQKGDDSVVYTLKPNYPTLLFHSDGNSAAYTPASFTLRCGYIKTVGDVRTVYDYPSGGTFGSYNLLYRIIQADGTPVATFAGDQPYGWDWIDNNNTGEFKDGNGNLVVPSSTNRIAIDFAVTKQAPRTCNDTTDVLAIIRVPIYKLSDGDKGDKGDTGSRGPALRGPQAWNDLPSNYHFQAGAEGQTYLDVVLYNGYYYLCTKAHNKAPSNYPGSDQDQIYHYWQLGDSVDLIATKVLLAANAVINFAQTNQILVMKSDGTTVALGLGGGSYPLWIGAPTAANASFKVDIDGKLVATGAEIGGKISAQSLTMPFEAVEGVTHTYALDDPCNIVLSMYGGGSTVTLSLPDNNSAFNGRRVIVSWPPMRTAMEANHAITGRIRCPNKDAGSAFYSSYFASRIESWAGGIAEFICIDSTWWLLNIESNGVQYTQYS
jgi:hypothetical protein